MKLSKIVLALAILVLLALTLIDRSKTNQQIQTLLAAQKQIPLENSEADSLRRTADSADLKESITQLEQSRVALAAATVQLNGVTAKVAELERKMDQLRNERALANSFASGSFASQALPQGRAWGPEQVIGPPDTHQAGDIQTAWASRQPDAGEEWLKLDYEKAVDLAEVRVRETYNPGAISRVSAFLVNGQEVVIWEGQEPPGEAPVETVFKVAGNVRAQSVRIYLDTSRVPGWNEIDAVEMVAKDGTRQWASQAAASSTYAEQGGALALPFNPAASQRELQLR